MTSQPPVIAIEQGKGGVAKTATAVALAEAAAEAGGHVMLVDSDPQGSATRWFQLAEASGRPLRSTIIGLATRDLPARLPIMAAGNNIVFIDGPPIREDLIEAGVQAADLVIMPIPPRAADMDRVPSLVKLAANRSTPILAVQTFTRADARKALAAREALTDMGVRVAETTIPLSSTVDDNYGQPPKGKLAAYGRELLAELLDILGEGA